VSQKHLRTVAIIILSIFAITIVVYPLIFGTDPQAENQPEVELEPSN